jgi:hypothetical protein
MPWRLGRVGKDDKKPNTCAPLILAMTGENSFDSQSAQGLL